jgi:hypothetical protein
MIAVGIGGYRVDGIISGPTLFYGAHNAGHLEKIREWPRRYFDIALEQKSRVKAKVADTREKAVYACAKRR